MDYDEYVAEMAKHLCGAHPGHRAWAIRRKSSMSAALARGIDMPTPAKLAKAHAASEAGQSGGGGRAALACGAPSSVAKFASVHTSPAPGGAFLACGSSGAGDPVFEAMAAAVTASKAGHPVAGAVMKIDPPLCIPISTAEHDATQLVYGRVGVPTCMSGDDCIGAQLRGAPGPLSLYMTPDEHAEFERTGAVPNGPHACMLCVMAMYENMVIHTEAIVAASSGLRTGHVVLPPFQHQSNVGGGYQSRYMVQATGPADRVRLCLPIDVLSTTAPMRVETIEPDVDMPLHGATQYRVSLAAAAWPPPSNRHFLLRGASVIARD